MNLLKATPVFIVDSITRETIAFWEATGWTKRVEVPQGEEVGFVLFDSGSHEAMLQTKASLAADSEMADLQPERALYIDVPSIDEARATLAKAGARVVIRERETAYGAKETWVLDPAGILVGFAEMKPNANE